MWFGLDTWTYWWHLVKRMSSAQLPLLARKPAWNRSKCNPVVSVVPRMMASLLIYSQIELPPCGAWSQVLAACAMQATDLHQHPSKVGFWLGNGTAMYEYSYVHFGCALACKMANNLVLQSVFLFCLLFGRSWSAAKGSYYYMNNSAV